MEWVLQQIECYKRQLFAQNISLKINAIGSRTRGANMKKQFAIFLIKKTWPGVFISFLIIMFFYIYIWQIFFVGFIFFIYLDLYGQQTF